MNSPKGISSHPGVDRVVSGESEGSDRKYWVFLKNGWGYYEHGQRQDYSWICGGHGVDSVAEFREVGLEYRPEKDMSLQQSTPDDDSPSCDM